MRATKFQKLTLGLLLGAASARCLAQASQMVLPEGSKMRVRLEQDLSSATTEEGQPVQLSVTEDVKVGDTVVIKQGTAVVGTVTQAVHKRRLGRTGKLDFSIERVVAADGTSIPLRYSPLKKDGGSHALATGIITAGAAVAFWPAAPFFLLIQGKDVTLHRGIEVDVFTDQTFTLRNAAAIASSEAAPSASAGSPVAVQITSQPQGAEITIDGAFVGSTPATVQMTPGLHRISVKRGRAAWERDMQVLSGNVVPVNAILSR
jgi:hypothetical protein